MTEPAPRGGSGRRWSNAQCPHCKKKVATVETGNPPSGQFVFVTHGPWHRRCPGAGKNAP